jgi:phage host-nuclease inhibitor protein Gam
MPAKKKEEPAVPVPLVEDVEEVKSFEDLELALGAIRLADARIAAIEARLDSEIQALQERRQALCKQHLDRKAAIEAKMEAFATANKDAIAPGGRGGASAKTRSRKFVNGVAGFKLSAPKLVYKIEEAMVMKMLEVRGHKSCVVVTKKIDKDEVKKLPASELKYVGAEVVQDDVFFYKINTDSAVEYPAAKESA